MTGDCNNISEQSSKPVSTPNNNLHKLLNIRSLKERKKKKRSGVFILGEKKMFLRFNWPFVGVNRLSHMRRSGQKIQLNRSFLQQQKQILTSAVLFLSEPIKTDSDSKGFLWKELKDVCVRGWVCVCVCGPTWTFAASVGCSCMRLHPEHWREERGISESRRWQKWAIYHFKTWQGCL